MHFAQSGFEQTRHFSTTTSLGCFGQKEGFLLLTLVVGIVATGVGMFSSSGAGAAC
jgi:hypothetical protein